MMKFVQRLPVIKHGVLHSAMEMKLSVLNSYFLLSCQLGSLPNSKMFALETIALYQHVNLGEKEARISIP